MPHQHLAWAKDLLDGQTDSALETLARAESMYAEQPPLPMDDGFSVRSLTDFARKLPSMARFSIEATSLSHGENC